MMKIRRIRRVLCTIIAFTALALASFRHSAKFFMLYVDGGHVGSNLTNNGNTTTTAAVNNKNPSIHFITYGNEAFAKSKLRITSEALDTGWFTSAKYFEPADLPPSFYEQWPENITSEPRGGGYWLWKFYIIEMVMNTQLKEGDYLVWLDAGCHINRGGEARFYQYIQMLNESPHGVLAFQLENRYAEYIWTTPHVFNAFNLTTDMEESTSIRQSGQVQSGTLIFQKSQAYREWMDLCLRVLRADPWLITDVYTDFGKRSQAGFQWNRHDQSIMSVAMKKLGYVRLDYLETQFKQPDKPFHVLRIKK
eukprot:CAMPEP_0183722974 /NCGR_PEP_ID=MMETSP0737-20130205/14750_1 /TAXON_ID=385413 /ORGANISM="Thalassiosira miniscula, Strain CCMP1093" /LENGTH=306 /DNA_ID=CAMNT_0025953223 /DNA_START=67 /DNA_END=987 /DNA_ORIENTATION=+